MPQLIWERNDVLARWYGRQIYTPDGRSDVLAIIQQAAGGQYRLFSIPGDLDTYTLHPSLEAAQLAAQQTTTDRLPYPHDSAIRALAAALVALRLARHNASTERTVDLLDQALEYVREAVACTNAAITTEADAQASRPDDETD
jgi:hypothetical protein